MCGGCSFRPECFLLNWNLPNGGTMLPLPLAATIVDIRCASVPCLVLDASIIWLADILFSFDWNEKGSCWWLVSWCICNATNCSSSKVNACHVCIAGFSLFLLVYDCSNWTCELFGMCVWVGQKHCLGSALICAVCSVSYFVFAKLMCVLDYH